jgi:hypothetical protein
MVRRAPMALAATAAQAVAVLAFIACIYGWAAVVYLWIQSGGGRLGAAVLPFGFFAWMIPWALLLRMD